MEDIKLELEKQINLLLQDEIYIKNKKEIYIENVKDIKLKLESHIDLLLKDEIYKNQTDIKNGIINILTFSLKKFIKIKIVGSSYLAIKTNIENIKKEIINLFIKIFNLKTIYFKIYRIEFEVDMHGKGYINPFSNRFETTIVGKETNIIFY